ncbi:MAG: Sir2 family NAD-dependent protein deacetylase [Polyangiales bacterium]
MDDDALRTQAAALSARLKHANRLLFITGAGLSAESGLPTYRGVGGLYADAEAETEQGMPIEVALSGPVFRRQPEVTWHHIARLEQGVRNAMPSAAHALIAALERSHEVVVLTQNVDGLHRAAGSSRVIDIHGDCHELLCTRCPHRETRTDYEGLDVPPRCPRCGAVVRPDVVLFEEMLPSHKLEALWYELDLGFDAYFSIGTSSLFPYISAPILDAARRGRLTVEINPEATDVSSVVGHRFATGAGRALSAIFAPGD